MSGMLFATKNCGGVPTLEIDGKIITQSLAIIEYLDEKFPGNPVLPKDAEARAFVRALSYIVATDMHQFANLPVLNYVGEKLGEDAKKPWVQKWLAGGFDALETMITSQAKPGKFCYGDQPTMADACLIPQMFAAKRFEVDLAPYPTLRRIDEECLKIKAFADAHPTRQPDAA
jgi:maleylacetoacetate isomerase